MDGDSLEMTGARIRLFGIDAVEAHQTCTRNGEPWACGQDAAAALRQLIDGKSIQCRQHAYDAYGRVVAACTANGLDLAGSMVRQGYAVALSEFSQEYVEIEKSAQARRVGIWSSEFSLPADFRASDPRSQAQDRALLAQEQRAKSARQAFLPSARATSSGVYYRNCNEARAAGAAPIYRGQPGYRPEMDGDNDGIACEPYRGR